MCDSIRGLLSKVWKDEVVDLAPGTHYLDEVLIVHVRGSVQKQADSLVAATTSLPFLSIIAFLLEKSGVTREHSLRMLREAVMEALESGTTKNERIQARMKDVDTAVKLVKEELVYKLPRQHRAGRCSTNNLTVTVLSEKEETTTAAA
jgi:hypothetical protein